jgi:hypothetical protein
LIINHIYPGLTLMFSRFAHFFREEEGHHLIAQLRATLQQLQPLGAVFAELKGGNDTTNLNLHPQVTGYELVCPGDLSSRPQDEQIPLEDLFIQDDERAGTLRLYSKRLGKEVIPLYLGFLHPIALPEIQQVLLNFSYAATCPLDLWRGVSIATDEDTIVYYPRLRYKDIVLQRAHWEIPAGAFPRRASGQPDEDFFLSVTRWRHTHGLPSRVFVTFESPRPTPSSHPAAAELAQRTRSYKPLYVDFENYFSVALLEVSLHDVTDRLHMTEMLPQADHLWLKYEGQSYISELVWEMNRYQGEI